MMLAGIVGDRFSRRWIQGMAVPKSWTRVAITTSELSSTTLNGEDPSCSS